jgi:EAL and modified HD-GYP domain-containing signal transduction protein
MDNLVARQPIFDKNLNVFGYEIVSRSGLTNSYGSGDGDHASLSAIRNAFLLLGTKIVAGRKKIFLDLPRPLIVDGVALTLPSEITVINVVVGTEADETLISACRALKEAHFSLSLEEESKICSYFIYCRSCLFSFTRKMRSLLEYFSSYN